MCVSGTWRAVGLNQWDDVDANVVCQHIYPGQKCNYIQLQQLLMLLTIIHLAPPISPPSQMHMQ